MLILSRKKGESVVMQHKGDEIVLTVRGLEYGRNQVDINFNAPDDAKIVRSELLGRAVNVNI